MNAKRAKVKQSITNRFNTRMHSRLDKGIITQKQIDQWRIEREQKEQQRREKKVAPNRRSFQSSRCAV